MPRQARIDAPGALHHIIARGIERRKIFRNTEDFDDFVRRLAGLMEETETDCFAWALIPNHFHLLLKTGNVPISTIMRRLLTGYAVSFNHRHRRHGHVFQNRYKSILCQEDTYLLELVRYIHLNPVRAGIVGDVGQLAKFAYAGHGAISGDLQNDWQNTEYVLGFFGNRLASSRQQYRQFVAEGAGQGRRRELTGGGMIRSLGGWSTLKGLGKTRDFHKSDERILGDSDFVDETLRQAEETWERQHHLVRQGIKFEHVLRAAAGIEKISKKEIMSPGKERWRVRARSLACYWSVRELGMTMTSLARESGLTVPAIAMAVRRGEKIVRENNYSLQGALNI